MNSKTTKKACGKNRATDCMENCGNNVTKKGTTSSPKGCSSCAKKSGKSDM